MSLSTYLAKQICDGFIYHDKKSYEKSINSFKNLYEGLFRIEPQKAEIMATCFVTALKLHDSIEDNFKGSAKSFFNHKIWKNIYVELVKFCNVIGLDKNYAKHYTKFLRYHSAYKKNFEMHLLRAEEIIAFHVCKKMGLAKIVAPLYLAGINSHDVHKNFTWRFNKKIMSLFYSLILGGE